MKKSALSLMVAACCLAVAASAEPVKLTKNQMDTVVAGVPSVHQQCCSPGTFPAGNPAKAPGQSNNPSGK